MTFWLFISWTLRLTGFVRWADFFMEKYETKAKAQAVANAPETQKELIDAFRKDQV